MAKLIFDYIAVDLDIKNKLELYFDGNDGRVDFYNLPKKYKHGLTISADDKEDGSYTIDDIYFIDIYNYEELEKVIDEEEALPEWNFQVVKETGEILEEDITLREFLKKYIYQGDLLRNIILEIYGEEGLEEY